MMRRRTAIAALVASAGVLVTGCPVETGGGSGGNHLTFVDESFRTGIRPMSADGRFVAFQSSEQTPPFAPNTYLFDRTTGATTNMSESGPEVSYVRPPEVSADGSTVYWIGSSPTPRPEGASPFTALFRFVTATGQRTWADLPPNQFGSNTVDAGGITVTRDGSAVAFSSSTTFPNTHPVYVWTEATGFTALASLPSDARMTSQAAISPSGRYLTTVELPRPTDPTPQLPGTPEQLRLRIHDLVTGTVATTWETGPRRVYGTNEWLPRLGGTFDDGSALFTYSSNAGVFRLSPAGTAAQVAGYENVGLIATSSNGRYVSFTGPSSIFPTQSFVNEITDRTTAVTFRVSGDTQPGLTSASAISDDGRTVLIYSSEPGRTPTTGLYLWDRS